MGVYSLFKFNGLAENPSIVALFWIAQEGRTLIFCESQDYRAWYMYLHVQFAIEMMLKILLVHQVQQINSPRIIYPVFNL